MKRFAALFLICLIVSCSDDPGPTAPAGKIVAKPDPPTNLRHDNPSGTSCRVRWDQSTGATGYDVRFKPSYFARGDWIDHAHRGNRLDNTLGGFDPTTTYQWAVRAKNKKEASDWVEGPAFTMAAYVPVSPIRYPDRWLDDLPDHAVFDIELVFLDDFPQWQKNEMRWTADLWELAFTDALADQPPIKNARQASCGDHLVDLSNRYVDDLTIFVARHYADGAMATGAVLAGRESDQTTSFGCITIENIDDHPPGMVLALYYDEVFAHEIGHVLGMGILTDRWVIENDNMYFEFSSDYVHKRQPSRHFLTAPSAMQALSEMGDWPTDAVPLTDRGDRAHWARFPLGNSILGVPSGYMNEPRITKVDLGVLADLGYPVGDPPTRPTPLMRKGVYNTNGDYYRVEGWNATWPHPRNNLRSRAQYGRGKAVVSPAHWCGVGRDIE